MKHIIMHAKLSNILKLYTQFGIGYAKLYAFHTII